MISRPLPQAGVPSRTGAGGGASIGSSAMDASAMESSDEDASRSSSLLTPLSMS